MHSVSLKIQGEQSFSGKTGSVFPRASKEKNPRNTEDKSANNGFVLRLLSAIVLLVTLNMMDTFETMQDIGPSQAVMEESVTEASIPWHPHPKH